MIEKSGSWLSYKGERIGQGRENAKQFLKDNTDIRQTIELEVRRALGLIRAEAVNGPGGRRPSGFAYAGSGSGRKAADGCAARKIAANLRPVAKSTLPYFKVRDQLSASMSCLDINQPLDSLLRC